MLKQNERSAIMCVICHKAANAALPDMETFRDMWDANKDGAGVMWREGKHVRYRKGFMKWDEFERWLNSHRGVLEGTECAFHFRITTHGGTNQGNCHPFPLDKKSNPHALKGKCTSVMMHNGILPLVPRAEDLSDTAELSLRAKASGNPMWYLESIAEFVGGDNRVLAFGPKTTLFIGKWHERNGNPGCKFSNLNFDFGSYYKRPSTASGAVGFGVNSDYELNDYYYDRRTDTWKDWKGHEVPFECIDPDTLSMEDYNIYWDMYDTMYSSDYDEWVAENERKTAAEPEAVNAL